MILSAQTITRYCCKFEMIVPFHERSHVHGMSFGVGPAGYDVRIAETVKLPVEGFSLASTMEQFSMPTNVLGIVHDKSTWARRGLALQNTVIEPGWKGYLTIELSNHGSGLLSIPAGCPIAQIIFHELDHATEKPYVGKYQNQAAGAQKAIFQDRD
jgi:dCTP deaminase